MKQAATPYQFSRPFLLRSAARMTVPEFAAKAGVKPGTVRSWEDGGVCPSPEMMDILTGLAPPPSRPADPAPSFSFIDLFAGIGGLRQAAQESGGGCVMTAEWNRFAVQTYAANFSCEHPVYSDVTKIPASEVPDHDLLMAGFPCQPFSLAGVSKKNSLGRPHGFEDKTQGTLFFDVCRIIAAKRPRAFLLENVKNLRSHDKGRTFKVIMDALTDELGYSVSEKVMDSSRWVPQKRERIVIVGMRDGPAFDFGEVEVPPAGPKLGSILHSAADRDTWDGRYAPCGDTTRYNLNNHLWNYLQEYAAKHSVRGNGFGYGLVTESGVTRTLSARYQKDGSEILLARADGNPRRLTPRECARLMGFDRAGLEPLRIPVSDTQSWHQFGNSVVVPMFAAVAGAVARRITQAGQVLLAA